MKHLILTTSLLLSPLPLWGDTQAEASKPDPSAAKLPGKSLYQLKSQWLDQTGKKVNWDTSGQGRARVLAMGYTTCKGICPRIVVEMQRIQKALTKEEQQSVSFTFLSLSPDVDKLPELKAFMDNYKLDSAWQAMTGDDDGVLEMAIALGIQFTKLPNGVDYAHSFLIAVVDEKGTVVHRWTSPNEGPGKSTAILKKIIRK